ncbi:MAG: Lrp/AsnC ligand binding domain-containing protein [bacterium]|nr:Lrp/AsnC ligand binding domain-containing protein [bacterium]
MEVLYYVFIKTTAGKTVQALTEIRKFPEIKEAHMVTGNCDIVAFLKSNNVKELGNIVAGKIHKMESVSSTTTCIVVE